MRLSADLRTAVQFVSLSQIEEVKLGEYMYGNQEMIGKTKWGVGRKGA